MKRFLILMAAILLSAQAYADMGYVETVFDDDIVETGTTIVSRAFPVKSSEDFGAWFEATPTTSASHPCTANCGSPNYSITMEMSPTDLSADFVTPVGVFPLADGVTASTARTVDVYTIPMPYMRFKFTNSAATYDTVVAMKLFARD